MIIKCPRCGHAGGNEVDVKRGLTLRCQYCLYTGNAVTDGRQLMNIERP